jgi:hypothetical protein
MGDEGFTNAALHVMFAAHAALGSEVRWALQVSCSLMVVQTLCNNLRTLVITYLNGEHGLFQVHG